MVLGCSETRIVPFPRNNAKIKEMPLTISRLRLWFATAAILLAVVVAGFYVYGRMRVHYAISQVPKKLGVDIQQSTQGFTLSKSEAGHTLFTIHASKAVQYKETGKDELRDVSVIVYGRQSNRYDQIYGSDFEYDPQSGNVTAKGEVHIDLEGNAGGPLNPDQTTPAELKNPVHLKTSGLTFNAKTGLASTNERIEFRVPQANGYATGASYDSKAATLTLGSHIVVTATGQNAQFTANHAVIVKGPNRAVFDGVQVARESGKFSANELVVYLREDNTVEHIVASGNVHAVNRGRTAAELQAARGDAWITENNQLKSAVFTGAVQISQSGEQSMNATAGKVDIAFGPNSRADHVVASDGVKLLQQAHGPKPSNAVEVAAAAINFELQDGRSLQQAVTSGSAQVTVLPAAGESKAPRTVATAGQFRAQFNRQNRLEHLVGAPDAKVVSSTPGQPDKISTSDNLEATFAASGGIETLFQDGRFHYLEPATTALASREAWAQRASYTPQNGTLTLTGSPRIVDGGLTTTADTIRLDRQAGDAIGIGDVKTTYSELKPQPGGALLASSDPIHVTAPSLRAFRNGATAIYSGGARLWQNASIVQAPVIEFNRDARKIVARTAEKGGGASAVTTTFVQQDSQGKSTPVIVRSAQLTYTDSERLARFDGGVVVRGSDTTLTAEHADVYLAALGQLSGKTAPSGPSQVDKITAEGHVNIQQPTRRATGEKLVYTAADGKFILTGGPPSIFDAERGKISGDSLTFFSRDDKVVAESGNSSPTVTRTRITR